MNGPDLFAFVLSIVTLLLSIFNFVWNRSLARENRALRRQVND